jgi:hypothetical protein
VGICQAGDVLLERTLFASIISQAPPEGITCYLDKASVIIVAIIFSI